MIHVDKDLCTSIMYVFRLAGNVTLASWDWPIYTLCGQNWVCIVITLHEKLDSVVRINPNTAGGRSKCRV